MTELPPPQVRPDPTRPDPTHPDARTRGRVSPLAVAAIIVAAIVALFVFAAAINDPVPDQPGGPATGLDDYDITGTDLLALTWADTSASQRADVCWGWDNFGPARTWELFTAGAGPDVDTYVTRIEFYDFMEDAC